MEEYALLRLLFNHLVFKKLICVKEVMLYIAFPLVRLKYLQVLNRIFEIFLFNSFTILGFHYPFCSF